MNPKISITVDAKNKAIATITGLATVGSDVDLEIRGLVSNDIESWAATDKFVGKALRFRIVDELGHDLVRFPIVEKSTTAGSTDGDQWQVTQENGEDVFKSYNGTALKPADFDTDRLRKMFHGIAFNETLEFGVILDSIVDKAEYATGKIKIRQWASCSDDDPTILPDWRTIKSGLDNATATVTKVGSTATISITDTHGNITTATVSDGATGPQGPQGPAGESVTLDDEVTEQSAHGVKSSGIWSWVKGLLPAWLTSSFGQPYTKTEADTLLEGKASTSHASTHAVGGGDEVKSKRLYNAGETQYIGGDKVVHIIASNWTKEPSTSPALISWFSTFEEAVASIWIWTESQWQGPGWYVNDGHQPGISAYSSDANETRIEFEDTFTGDTVVFTRTPASTETLATTADITSAVSTHNAANDAHNDIRTAVNAKVGSFAAVGGVTPTVSGGVADVSPLFTSANTSLNLSNVRTESNDATSAKSYIDTSISDACPYGVNVLTAPSDLQLVDGCVNTINLNAADVHLVLPTMPIGKQADLLIEITVAAGSTVSGFSIVAPSGATMERIRLTDDVTLEAPASGTTIYQFMYTSRRTDDGTGTPTYRVYSAQKKGEVVA